jgi:hypothetical protein
MGFGTMCIALAILAASPVLAHAGRYELIPEPDVRQSSTNRVASAYVIDKKASQFWICTARIFRISPRTTATVSGFRPISAGPR